MPFRMWRRWNFYPRPPRGGRLLDRTINGEQHVISIHALREEGDVLALCCCSVTSKFLSTPSARRATRWSSFQRQRPEYFYPRPPRGGRLLFARHLAAGQHISIHALREEGDQPWAQVLSAVYGISIHALREEGDAASIAARACSSVFLSTPSARRATACIQVVRSNT